jgi:hypothetical protein
MSMAMGMDLLYSLGIQMPRATLMISSLKFETEDTPVAGDVTIAFCIQLGITWSKSTCQFWSRTPRAATIKYCNNTERQLCFISFDTSFHHSKSESKILFIKTEIDGAYDKSHLDFMNSFSMTVDILSPGSFSRLGTRQVLP